MNPHYTEFKFPAVKPQPWAKVGRGRPGPPPPTLLLPLPVSPLYTLPSRTGAPRAPAAPGWHL
jgi:hypothetical protein